MNNKSILLDAGPLVAIIRTSQQNHKQCVETLATLAPPLSTCWPVLTEAAYLLRHRPREVISLLDMIEVGFLQLLPLGQGDLKNIRAIFDRFHDQSFQLADVCLMHLAEREDIEHVFTLDRRDFSVFRTSTGKSLQILPSG